MSDASDSPAVLALLGDEVLVRGFAGESAVEAADRCLTALIHRYGDKEARDGLRAALKRRRMTAGKSQNLLMEALHDQLARDGARDPTAQVEKLFGGGGPLGAGQKRASVKRRLRRVKAQGGQLTE